VERKLTPKLSVEEATPVVQLLLFLILIVLLAAFFPVFLAIMGGCPCTRSCVIWPSLDRRRRDRRGGRAHEGRDGRESQPHRSLRRGVGAARPGECCPWTPTLSWPALAVADAKTHASTGSSMVAMGLPPDYETLALAY
jgi:hypothetical protein